jgi:hypothetical protein
MYLSYYLSLATGNFLYDLLLVCTISFTVVMFWIYVFLSSDLI